jgi:hypothetical protein
MCIEHVLDLLSDRDDLAVHLFDPPLASSSQICPIQRLRKNIGTKPKSKPKKLRLIILPFNNSMVPSGHRSIVKPFN